MEDSHVTVTDNSASVFGVYDGHGGRAVAAYVEADFETVFREKQKLVQSLGVSALGLGSEGEVCGKGSVPETGAKGSLAKLLMATYHELDDRMQAEVGLVRLNFVLPTGQDALSAS